MAWSSSELAPDRHRGVGVVIPTLNEADRIDAILDAVANELTTRSFTVCVVDDGSTDGTREKVRARKDDRFHLLAGKKAGPGCQRGAASRAGLRWLLDQTEHGVFVDLDADGSQRPAELNEGVELVSGDNCDVAIASKYTQGARVVGRPWSRRLVSRGYNYLLRVLLKPCIRDYSNSYRFYNRRAAELLYQGEPRYTTPVYLIEMMAVWLSHGLRIVEFPTLYDSRAGGASKVSTADFVRCLPEAVKLGWSYRLGRYRF